MADTVKVWKKKKNQSTFQTNAFSFHTCWQSQPQSQIALLDIITQSSVAALFTSSFIQHSKPDWNTTVKHHWAEIIQLLGQNVLFPTRSKRSTPSNRRLSSFSSRVSSSRAAERILPRVYFTRHTSLLLRSPYSPISFNSWSRRSFSKGRRGVV